MEEIKQLLQEILLQNNNSNWFTYVSTFVPLILTVISIFSACMQHKQNLNLQKQIANRDSANLLRQNVIEIYNAYFNGLSVVHQASGNVNNVFSTPQSIQQWAYDLEKSFKRLSYAYNQAKLIFNDDELVQALKRSFRKFESLYNCVNRYYHSGVPIMTIRHAWAVISKKYMITEGDYVALSQYSSAMEKYVELCGNENTENIQSFMEEFEKSVSDEVFDIYFKKYIQLNEL